MSESEDHIESELHEQERADQPLAAFKINAVRLKMLGGNEAMANAEQRARIKAHQHVQRRKMFRATHRKNM